LESVFTIFYERVKITLTFGAVQYSITLNIVAAELNCKLCL